MTSASNLGYPRTGRKRELKRALESYWDGRCSQEELIAAGKQLRSQAWALQHQAGIDLIPANEFSFYDHVLDTAAMVGAVPARFKWSGDSVDLQTYFLMARGTTSTGSQAAGNGRVLETSPLEMTKWFNTNYHYMVPEVTDSQVFRPAFDKCLLEYAEAKELGVQTRPVFLGPVSFLCLSKGFSSSKAFTLSSRLVDVYLYYLNQLHLAGCEWVQFDEPCLGTDLDALWQPIFQHAYDKFSQAPPKVLLASYFSSVGSNLPLLSSLPVDAWHLDLINGRSDLEPALKVLPADTLLSAGIIDGHNVWRTDLSQALDLLEFIAEAIGPERLIVSPSCSLMHVPVDVEMETALPEPVRPWLAFADQKIEEVAILTDAMCIGRAEVQKLLQANLEAIAAQKSSALRHVQVVETRLKKIGDSATNPKAYVRKSPFSRRKEAQRRALNLPLLPTTTIGSFPQTKAIRDARKNLRSGKLSEISYAWAMESEIKDNIKLQEKIGLDVLVHGEPERSDMVEYFAEMLDGIAVTQHGWVQSYGSRYVKPPIIYGTVSRPASMTVRWAKFAQGLTKKPVKGMLTGPVTILQWSFVRDDQPREVTCLELALAVRDEVEELESQGIQVIQIDEPAIREGLPLRRADWGDYLRWSVDCFRLCSAGVKDETQIHTHMCYSEFADMIDAIVQMDADVISIEAARSQMDFLLALKQHHYPNEIGPGVYDIHSPRVPSAEEIEQLLRKALEVIPVDRLWINPDCGLKTRNWEEVVPALNALVESVLRIRNQVSAARSF